MKIWAQFTERILNKIYTQTDPWERKTLLQMREQGQLRFLSELVPYFQNTDIFCFGTGGSVANLEDVERLRDHNLMICTTGPLHLYRRYGFMPSIWVTHNWDSVRVLLDGDVETPLDFSDTFIFVPANDSHSKIHFSSPLIKELRRKHPEATYILYRELVHGIKDYSIPPNYLTSGVEPIEMHYGSVLEGLFLPFCGFLGASVLYFSGIDQLPTGHFWDREFEYQSIYGEKLDFPQHENTIKINKMLLEYCLQRDFRIFRLEANETMLQMYPHLNFEQALAQASPRIGPSQIGKPPSYYQSRYTDSVVAA